MTVPKTFFVASMALLIGGCATSPPVPVEIDKNAPTAVEAGGLEAALFVLNHRETDRFFGNGASARVRVLGLEVANHGAALVGVDLKQIRIVTPSGERQSALTPLDVAKLTRGPGMSGGSTGNNALDGLRAVFGLLALKQNRDLAESWSHMMPETLKVAPGGERRIFLAFQGPDWAAGTWRLELPFAAEQGASSPPLSIPLTFKELPSRR